ncbi:MAG TPA: SDR family NAD(P)-dependent oxidoreductase [Azospirillaceae bacterium]|nr:SDR family NAD(P)-dependent oxidoreductase [Azospirillaceae bacterium]
MPSATYNPMDLTGRHVLVTGASAGIGRATAEMLARLGARLTVTGRDEERLSGTLARLEGEGHRAAAFDLTRLDEVAGWMKGLAAEGGPFDGVAHCAGIQSLRPIRIFSAEYFDEMMRSNLGASLAIAKGLRQKGVRAERSSLVFVSSTAAEIAAPGNVVYAASKGGMLSATRGLAMELLSDGIRVNAVVPSVIETDLIERAKATLTAEQYEAMVGRQPLGAGRPEDVAHAIAFLLADTGRFITGASLVVDGGLTMV